MDRLSNTASACSSDIPQEIAKRSTSPDLEPLNVDPTLIRILAQNRAIHLASTPLHTFTPYSHRTSLLPIIAQLRLSDFDRQPESEILYRGEFTDAVVRKYGSMEGYLRGRLGWFEGLRKEDDGQHFKADGIEGQDWRIADNEWVYGIEHDVSHLCVWSRLPLLNRAAATSSTEWGRALSKGVGGFTNLTPGLAISLPNAPSVPGCARELAAFVEMQWPASGGWMTAWFMNPPALQSVRGLAHFHVLARRRPL